MRVYLYDDWVRIDTDYGTWKYDSDELTEIQRTVDRECGHNDIEFVDIKSDGYTIDEVLPHEVEYYIEDYYEEDEE